MEIHSALAGACHRKCHCVNDLLGEAGRVSAVRVLMDGWKERLKIFGN